MFESEIAYMTNIRKAIATVLLLTVATLETEVTVQYYNFRFRV